MKLLLGILMMLACSAIFAQEPQNTLQDLRWLSGWWQSEDGKVEEVWMAPAGGIMVGMNRTLGRKRAFFELIRIEERNDALFYIAMPRGQSEVHFRIVSLEARKAVFENPDHDFPQRIIYQIEGQQLCASIEGLQEGQPRKIHWCWQKVSPPNDIEP